MLIVASFESCVHCVCFLPPSAPCRESNEQAPSKAVKRAKLTPPLTATAWRGEREDSLHGRLDLNGNINMSSPAAVDSEAQHCHREDEAALEDLELKSVQSQCCISQGRRMLNSVLVVVIVFTFEKCCKK